MTTEIKKMMLATDFSETSKKAQATAAYLQQALGCSLDVVHVFDPAAFEMPAPYYFMPGVEQWIDQHFSGMRDHGRTALDELLPELGECAKGHFLEGRADKEIVKFANDHEIDLIVMGTHGHKGFNHLVLGSVAEQVIRNASCPVLACKCEDSKKGD